MRTLVVHWADLASRLPLGTDYPSKSRRRELFESIDVDGKGILFQGNVLRALRRLLPTVSGVPDTTPMLSRAWKTTVTVVKPVAEIGLSWIDRNQFRVLLLYIWHYLKVWELLVQRPLEVKGHVSLPEFEAALPSMREWGFQEAEAWSADASVAWDRLTHASGIMDMEGFADRVVSGALLDISSADEEDERKTAARMLERTHPHLLQLQPRIPEGSTRGRRGPGAVPPPGQKRPPASIAEEQPPTRRWSTQYMSDYEPPSRSEAVSSVLNSVAPSRASRAQSQAHTRAGTPPRRFDIAASLAHGSRATPRPTAMLRESRSLPEVNKSLQELDREALRRKLQRHVEMSNTCNMRKLLQAAGGMVMSPSAKSVRMG